MKKLKPLFNFLSENRKTAAVAAAAAIFFICALMLASSGAIPAWVILPLALLGLIPVLSDHIPHLKLPAALRHICSVMFIALVADIAMQCLSTGRFMAVLSPKYMINYLIYCFIIAVVTALLPSMFSGLIASGILMTAWSILNYCLVLFRNRVFYLSDLFSLKTALLVAGNYHFSVSRLFITTVLFLISALAIALIPYYKKSEPAFDLRALPRYCASISALLAAVLMLVFAVPTKLGFSDERWIVETKYYMYSFFVAISDSVISPPDGYSAESAVLISDENPSDSSADFDIQNAPNVIVVMDEAFSDLASLGEIGTNIPVTPFTSSLSENTIKGHTFSSVFGGNTANSEYEFLTGDSMAFVPDGSVPYNSYISGYYPSIVKAFDSLGYSTLAMHAYYSYGWSRVSVYQSFGFDDTLFMDGYQDTALLRSYIDDSSNFKNVIRRFEEKGEDERMFIFNITMQNHGGYDTSFDNFEQEVYLTDHPGEYPMAEQYLSLIHRSDAAACELVEYFSTVDEPTVICFFGDHQPQLESGFYTELYGKPESELTNEEAQRKYASPFFIWANYDIDEITVDKISINYLSTLLFKTAGLPMTGYQHFLDRVYSEYPVISAIGVIDKDGNYFPHGSEPESELLDKYRFAVYNHLFDKRNRCDALFELQ